MRVLKQGIKFIGALALVAGGQQLNAGNHPNVILIMTDDQGYGDIAAHGHPHLITPNMDRLHANSVRLERFHVDPTCAPSRAALMTGRYSGRVGVWHTIRGRNLLREDEVTMADVFRSSGYRTGIFGKWHLGDSYPYGARFRGFDDAIVHHGGGVGQTPDYWGNDYFEDHYNDNGVVRRYQGYCTDVWFGEALRFIRESGDQPFFLYLPTNAAHQTRPHVPERYKNLYADIDEPEAVKIFCGMITNIDDNLGVMMDRLQHWGLIENTIIIFIGDNGTCMGAPRWPQDQQPAWPDRFNAGMRGAKNSHYDGGHRVFGYVHYPAAGITGGHDVDQLTAHIDLMPTLLELCGIATPDHVTFDGKSLVPLLTRSGADWPERTLFVHNQRVVDPEKWRNTSVMTDKWRFVDNTELYDMSENPGQQNNVIDRFPLVADSLRRKYDIWWDDIRGRFHEISPLYVGSDQQNPVELNAHDWMTPYGQVPWNQPQILSRPESNGPWQIRVAKSGRYEIVLRERPEIADFVLTATEARLQVGETIDMVNPVARGATSVRFEAVLQSGDTTIQTWLTDQDGTSRGAYFVEVTRLE